MRERLVQVVLHQLDQRIQALEPVVEDGKCRADVVDGDRVIEEPEGAVKQALGGFQGEVGRSVRGEAGVRCASGLET